MRLAGVFFPAAGFERFGLAMFRATKPRLSFRGVASGRSATVSFFVTGGDSNASRATFAAAVLPLVHACSAFDAEVLYDHMSIGSTANPEFTRVKRAFGKFYQTTTAAAAAAAATTTPLACVSPSCF